VTHPFPQDNIEFGDCRDTMRRGAAEGVREHGQYSGVVDIARNGIDELIRLKAQAKRDTALMRQALEWIEAQPEPRMIGAAKISAALRGRLEGKA
jgi:hypothetical protein